MNYIKLYKAANASEAYFIKGLLKKASIDTQLLGEGLSVAIGELPLEVMQVDLLVHKDKFNEAKKIMSDYEKQQGHSLKLFLTNNDQVEINQGSLTEPW